MNKFYFIIEPPRNLIDFDPQDYTDDLITALYDNREGMYLQHHLESKYIIMNLNTYDFIRKFLGTTDSLEFIANDVDMRLNIIKHCQMECRFLNHTVLINNSLKNFEYEIR